MEDEPLLAKRPPLSRVLLDWLTVVQQVKFSAFTEPQDLLPVHKISPLVRNVGSIMSIHNFFPHGATIPSGPEPRGFVITLRHNTHGRTPLDEWSARRRDLYLTTHGTHKKQTSMSLVRFEWTILASEGSKTHTLDRAATGITSIHEYLHCFFKILLSSFGATDSYKWYLPLRFLTKLYSFWSLQQVPLALCISSALIWSH